jgi:hypothetical protein
MFVPRRITTTIGPVTIDLQRLTVAELTTLSKAIAAEAGRRSVDRARQQRIEGKDVFVPVVSREVPS